MSRLELTAAERVEALQRIGYGSREADFACLAGLHSGYFLRRQFCKFIGKQAGGSAAALIDKIQRLGHGRALPGCRNTHVYHLFARPFYAALGEEDNRNRRMRSPGVIKAKLMALDVILEFPALHFLATEHEKVTHFTRTCGIDAAHLPCKVFRSPTAADSTTRFFVDRFPIALEDDGRPSFWYIDQDDSAADGLSSYLRLYSPLFEKLRAFDIVYAGRTPGAISRAQALFQRVSQGSSSASASIDGPHLLSHFEDRRAYEEGSTREFDRARLIRLREGRRRFAGNSIDLLFNTWKAGGEAAIRTTIEHFARPAAPFQSKFRGHLLRQNYDVFEVGRRVSYAS